MPTCTPPQSEFGLASNLAAGRAATASFPKSRLLMIIAYPSKFQFPTFFHAGPDEIISLAIVREAQIPAVPFELARNAPGDDCQREPLGERRGDAEIGARCLAALAGADPVRHVTRGSREQLGWEHVLLPSRGGQQLDALAAVTGGHDAFRADENGSVARENSGLLRARRSAEDRDSGPAGAGPHRRGSGSRGRGCGWGGGAGP